MVYEEPQNASLLGSDVREHIAKCLSSWHIAWNDWQGWLDGAQTEEEIFYGLRDRAYNLKYLFKTMPKAKAVHRMSVYEIEELLRAREILLSECMAPLERLIISRTQSTYDEKTFIFGDRVSKTKLVRIAPLPCLFYRPVAWLIVYNTKLLKRMHHTLPQPQFGTEPSRYTFLINNFPVNMGALPNHTINTIMPSGMGSVLHDIRAQIDWAAKVRFHFDREVLASERILCKNDKLFGALNYLGKFHTRPLHSAAPLLLNGRDMLAYLSSWLTARVDLRSYGGHLTNHMTYMRKYNPVFRLSAVHMTRLEELLYGVNTQEDIAVLNTAHHYMIDNGQEFLLGQTRERLKNG